MRPGDNPGNDATSAATRVRGLVKSFRAFWLTLWNTYAFFVTYANLDAFNPLEASIPLAERSQLDRWVLSELHTLVKSVTEAYETYDVTGATRPIEKFVGDLSNWHVRRSRSRFWRSENDQDKAAAYLTLYDVLATVAKLLAPAMPFMADELYRNLVSSVDASAPESVHLVDWPEVNESAIDNALMNEMRLVMRLVSLGQRPDKLVGMGQPCRPDHVVKRRVRPRQPDILGDTGREQIR